MNIKYEKLSSELKNEIQKYHENCLKEDSNTEIEKSMNKWFEYKFDNWLINNYSEEDAERRRRFGRIDIELPVKVVDTLIEGSNSEDSEFDVVGTIKNISRGGLYFNTNKPIKKSSIIKVIIDMGEIDSELINVNALAMVVREEKIKDNLYGIGIMFSSIDDEEHDTLDMHIFKKFAYFLYK